MKKLIIDKEYPNGILVDMTPEEIAEMQKNTLSIPYAERVANRIRERYTIDDELALHRQRDKKPEEFAEYDAFVENIKAEEKAV